MDPSEGRGAGAPYAGAEDEISLRELYLILKGGIVWIVGVALAVAVVAFLVMHLQPERYSATATVRVTPLQAPQPQSQSQSDQRPAGQQQTLVNLAGMTQIGFDAFRALALSQSTLQATLKAMPSVPDGLTTASLADRLTLSNLSGSGGDPLVVAQQVTYRDPQVAAALANAWANASAAAVRDSVSTTLGHLRQTTAGQLTSAGDALNAAEAKWTAFQKNDDRSTLQAQLTSLDQRITGAQNQLDALERQAAATQAKQTLLRAVVEARSQGNAGNLKSQVDALAGAGVIEPGLASDLTRALGQVPGGTAQSVQDAATLVARTQLQQQASDLAGYAAERKTIRQQLDGFAKQQADLRSKLATQQQTADQLQRQRDTASQAYQQLAAVAPLLQAAGTLAPDVATVFSKASAPERPLAHRTVTVTLVAFVLALFVMTLGVFLRAAVVEPREGGGAFGARPPKQGDATSGNGTTRDTASPAYGSREDAADVTP